MKKLIATALAVVLLASLMFAGYSAQANTPSTKTAVASTDLDGVTLQGGEEVLNTTIRVSGVPKDLVIAVTAECALVTNVTLKGKDTKGDLSQANLTVWVEVDDQVALPGKVVFADRLMRVRGDLNDTNAWFEIFMATRNANGFNFIARDVGQGEQTIRVFADSGVSDGRALGLIGNITLVVDEVNLKDT